MARGTRVLGKTKACRAVGKVVALGGEDGLLIELTFLFLLGVTGLKFNF